MRYRLILLAFFVCYPLIDAPYRHAMAQQRLSVPRGDGAQTTMKLYGDWRTASCPPTVILSHGLGGNEDGLAYVGEALAAAGYRVAVMRHEETGRRALFRTMLSRDKLTVITDPARHAARLMDLEAAIGFSTHSCRPPLLVLGGHSMGAATTMLEAGATGKVQVAGSDRFDAYIALSPQGVGWMFDEGAWSAIRKPVLMITGTEDSGFDGDYTTRLAAFEGLPAGNKRLAIIEGASHLNLGGRRNEMAQQRAARVMLEFLNQLKHERMR